MYLYFAAVVLLLGLISVVPANELIDETARSELRGLLEDRYYSGPERYRVRVTYDALPIKPKQRRVDEIEVLREGDQLRITETRLVENSERCDRPAQLALLVNRDAMYRVGKKSGDAFFSLYRIGDKRLVRDPIALNGAIGILENAFNHALGDWFGKWCVQSGLAGHQGYELMQLERDGSRFHGIVRVDKSARSTEFDIFYEFWVNDLGLVERWGYTNIESPTRAATADMSWGQDEQYLGVLMSYSDRDRLIATWDAKVEEYNREPIDEGEFSLEHFGLQTQRRTISPVWVLGALVGGVACFVWWRRQRR